MAKTFNLAVVLDFQDRASQGLKDIRGNLMQLANVAKKAFDFGKAGAEVAQTTESFGRLGVSIDEMRKASRGTIDDMTLMSSTLTLTAGASDSLQEHLLSNAPQLLEIAKAANKLNPTLGDTAFQYESLALGIKRSSPMILDNLGLTIKIGQANEEYAVSIGKTVDQLSAEEKQIALLNATIKAGDRLIEQAGGNVDALGDEYAQMEVAVKNASDALKKQLFPAISAIVKPMAEQIIHQQDIVELLGQEAVSRAYVAQTYKGQKDAMEDLEGAYEQAIANAAAAEGYTARLALEHETAAPLVGNSATAFEQYNNAIAAADTAKIQQIADNTQAASDAANNAAIAFDLAASSLGEMSMATFVAQQIDLLTQAFNEDKISADQLRDATHELLIKSGELTKAEALAQWQIEQAAGAMQAGKLTAEQYASALLGIRDSINDIPSYKSILIETKHIDTYGGLEGMPEHAAGLGGIGQAGGFSGVVSQPTLMRFGEAGPERVIIQPQTTNNYDVVVNTRASSGTYAQDIMQAQALAQ